MTDMTGTAPTDWGPFGRPLFNDPKARALSRVGVVDVGSNSVRLVVFDGAARSPAGSSARTSKPATARRRPVAIFGVSAMMGRKGRSRATRKPVEPEPV